MSALPPKADMVQRFRDVRSVPKGDIRNGPKLTGAHSRLGHFGRKPCADSLSSAHANASTGLLGVADTRWRPLVCVVIGMLASGVISRCPRCRLSARDTLTLRDPVSKVWSVLDAVLHL